MLQVKGKLTTVPYNFTDNFCFCEEVFFVSNWNSMKQETMFKISGIFLNDVAHVTNLLLQLLYLVLELLGLLNRRIDLLATQTVNGVLELTEK